MKKTFTLLVIAFIAFSFKAVAQTSTDCNANFSFTISGNTVQFTPVASTDSSFIYHHWKFGDTSAVLFGYAPAHTYPGPGTYVVTQYVAKSSSSAGSPSCSDSVKETIIIPASPNCEIYAAYTFVRDSTQPNTIDFTNISKGINAISYVRWYFGDSTYSTVYSPSHTFTKPGSYTVCLLVKYDSLSSCSSDTCMTITIPVIDPLPCNIQAYFNSTTDSSQNYGINFHDYTTNLLPTDSSYWSFGDSTTSRDLNPTHIYAQAGTYDVCLTITRITTPGTTPCTSKFCRTIVIQPLCNLKVAYTWKVDSLNQNTIDFSNTTPISSAGSLATWSFGDGSATDSSWNATHTYTQPGKYYVCLRILTNNTCINYLCDSVTVPTTVCNFQPSYTWQLDTRTANTVDFTNTTVTTVTGATALWFFGDDSSANTWSTMHTFAQPGKYYTCLRVQLNSTCYKYQCDTITIPAPVCKLQANYTWKVDSLNQNTIDFTNTTITNVTPESVRWSFGDGSPLDSTLNATHTFAQPGKYYVCLRVQTSSSCVSYQCDSVTVPAPVCNFQPSYTWQLDTRSPNTVDFTNTTVTTVAGATALWFFGDDSSASTWSTTHTFAQPGKYYTCLRVQLNSTCYKYQCDTITIPAPVVCNIQSYFYDNVDSLQYNKIHFTDETLNLAPTDSLYWSFGDSTTSRDANPIHIYTNPGTYDACLTVTRITVPGTTPCTSKFCRTIVIQPVCNLAANFTYKKDSLAVDANTYQFTNTSTPANSFDSSYWNFGDGTSSYDTNPTHVFANGGTYTVCLYIKNAANSATTTACESHTCQTVIVPTVCNIKAAYTWQLDTLKQNTVDFINTTNSTTSAASAKWIFGDGSPIDSTWNASHTYTQPGKYYVCLRVQTITNCVSYQCDSIIVPTPVPNCEYFSLFSFAQSSTNSQAYTFTPVYQNTAVKYTWTFGDTTGSENIIAQHSYIKPGYYTACLTAYRDSNCASTTCKEISVIQQANCDSIKLIYSYYPDGNTPNEIHFYTNINFPVQQQYWIITSLTNPADSAIVIAQTNPVYVFTDTGYYNVCVRALTVGNCVKEYCNTIHITTIATPCELQTYPNPANTEVGVNVQLANPELIHAYLYNMQSVLLQQTYQQGNTGTNLITMDTEKLAAGFYTIELIYGNKACFAKFQKL